MRIVTHQFQMLESEVIDILDRGVQFQVGESEGLQLVDVPQLVDVVAVDVHVCQHVHELPPLQTSHLRNQASEQGIAGDVERHS